MLLSFKTKKIIEERESQSPQEVSFEKPAHEDTDLILN